MAFGDEATIDDRWLNFGWRPRAEGAEQIARRLQRMASDLGRDEPDLSPLWLQFSSRATRPTDPERVDTMAITDLARLIDRRARFDPPPLPAPVGPEGYALSLGGPPSLDPARRIDISMRAGRREDRWLGNGGVLHLLSDAPIWRSTERGLAVVRVLVRAWEPDGVGAYGRKRQRVSEHEDRPPVRPWITWSRDGANYEFYEFAGVGEPTLVSKEMGGELCVWP